MLRAKTVEEYTNQFRAGSPILGDEKVKRGTPTILGIPFEIKRRIDRVKEARRAMKTELRNLDLAWDQYKRDQVKHGNPKPTVWPNPLLDKKHKFTARVLIHDEELKVLDQWYEEAKLIEKAHNPEADVCLPNDKAKWGNCILWNSKSSKAGLLKSIGGQEVRLKLDKNGDEILFIDDPRSQYNGMPVWRFKAEILRPMSHQFNIRVKNEARAAQKEDRVIRKVNYPTPPAYNKKTGLIEYPASYDPRVIAKVKNHE